MCHISGVTCQVQVSCVRCQVSAVSCQLSGVSCQVSGVTCHIFYFIIFFLQTVGASRWRVCYQRGLPRLVLDVYRVYRVYCVYCVYCVYHDVYGVVFFSSHHFPPKAPKITIALDCLPSTFQDQGSGYSLRGVQGSLHWVCPVQIPSKCWGESNLRNTLLLSSCLVFLFTNNFCW